MMSEVNRTISERATHSFKKWKKHDSNLDFCDIENEEDENLIFVDLLKVIIKNSHYTARWPTYWNAVVAVKMSSKLNKGMVLTSTNIGTIIFCKNSETLLILVSWVNEPCDENQTVLSVKICFNMTHLIWIVLTRYLEPRTIHRIWRGRIS